MALDVGVARANVYAALEELARRGAARKSATVPAQYTAAGPAALIAELERSFRHDVADLEERLRALPIGGTGQAELELITAADQLVSRAVSCADGATGELFAVLGPWVPEVLARLAAAAARRVQLRVVSLGDPSPEWALSRPVAEAELRGYWGGLPVALVADRGRAVFGVMADGRTASGIATGAAGAVPFIRHLLRREYGAS